MTKKFNYTFDSWKTGECSEVKHVDPGVLEREGYQSTYVFMFNYLRDKGWTFQHRRWVEPEEPYQTYGKIHLAYDAQKMREVE